MDQVRILFVGLILHMNLDGSNTAVLPFVNEHEITATVYRASGTEENEISLKDLEVDISGAISEEGDGKTRHEASFDRDVPHLQPMEPGHEPLDKVKKHQKVGSDIAAYVEYDGGSLSSFEINKTRVSITGVTGKPICVACGVIWSGKPTAGTITMSFRNLNGSGLEPEPVTLQPGDRVIIRNADPKNGKSSGDHFPHVFKTLKGGASKEHHIDEQTGPPFCTEAVCHPEEDFLAEWRIANERLIGKGPTLFVHVIPADCTNSQYP